MKAITLPNVTQDQTAWQLDTGEKIIVQVQREVKETGETVLTFTAWQVNDDGTRYTDEQGGAVILPLKQRTVPSDETLEDQVADAVTAVVARMEKHIAARKQLAEARARSNPMADADIEQL